VRAGVRFVALVALGLGIAGCGVPTQNVAHATPDDQVPSGLLSPTPPTTTTLPPTTATTGQRYQSTFTASGAPLPKFSVGSGTLPPGLKLGRDGVLSGRPTTGGTYTFTVAASNGVHPGAATPPITINVSQPPTITAATPPTAWSLNVFGFYHFLATGLPEPAFSVSKGSLPPGLVLYPNGSFGGVPTAVGSWTFTLSASNGVSPNAIAPPITLTVS